MLYVSIMYNHHQAFQILKCVSTYVTGRLVYSESIAGSPVLHKLFQDYNTTKYVYIGLIIELGKFIIYFHYYN
jgi:hypothetical protein